MTSKHFKFILFKIVVRFGSFVTSGQMLCSINDEVRVFREMSLNCAKGVVLSYFISG